MKTKFIQTCYALILPIAFIVILMVLNALPFTAIDKYTFGGILVTLIALFLTCIAVKIDGKTFKEIGFYLDSKTPYRFLKGFLIGLFLAVLMFIVVISFSSVNILYNNDANISAILFWLLAFFPLAYMEEVIFRGYAFTKINKTIGLWPAQILLALLFTWYHDFTGATFFNQLLGPGVWALVYGIAAIWSKGIALPTGLHMALNVVIALVGEKDGRAGIWYLEYVTEVTSAELEQTNSIGLILQICILAIGIVLTEYYRRKKILL